MALTHWADLDKLSFESDQFQNHKAYRRVMNFDPMWTAACGNLTGVSAVHKFGHNDSIGAALEDLWTTGGVYPWPTTAVALEAISTDATDNAAGAGARTITVEGLDANFAEQTATITMHASDGTNASDPTVEKFIRVNRAYIATGGTYADTDSGSHVGTIVIRASGAGATQITLHLEDGIAQGQSTIARYTVPAGKNALLTRFSSNFQSTTKTANIYLLQRPSADVTSAPFGAKRLVIEFTGISGTIERKIDSFIKFEEKTDIWVAAIASAVGAKVAAQFDLIMFDTTSATT